VASQVAVHIIKVTTKHTPILKCVTETYKVYAAVVSLLEFRNHVTSHKKQQDISHVA
jgi:hypothetical protein